MPAPTVGLDERQTLLGAICDPMPSRRPRWICRVPGENPAPAMQGLDQKRIPVGLADRVDERRPVGRPVHIAGARRAECAASATVRADYSERLVRIDGVRDHTTVWRKRHIPQPACADDLAKARPVSAGNENRRPQAVVRDRATVARNAEWDELAIGRQYGSQT